MQSKIDSSISLASLSGKVALVTGAARGIGKNIAKMLAANGANVIICDINQEIGEMTAKELREIGLNVQYLYMDISLKGMPKKMIELVASQWGRLDILVNNARSGQRIGILEENEDTWEDAISVTLRAAFFASQEAVRIMARQQGGGTIINIGSVTGMLTCINESPIYHIAKAGLMKMTQYFAVLAGHDGIRVNCVMPGFIVQDEQISRYAGDDNKWYRDIAEFSHPLGHVGCADDIANTVLYFCTPFSAFITGQCLCVDGGLTSQDQSSLLFKYHKEMKDKP